MEDGHRYFRLWLKDFQFDGEISFRKVSNQEVEPREKNNVRRAE